MPSPQDVLQYLLAKGVPHAHALGMLANIRGESSFNPTAVGDNGNSYGLFQHNGPRRRALFDFAGGTPSWQQHLLVTANGRTTIPADLALFGMTMRRSSLFQIDPGRSERWGSNG